MTTLLSVKIKNFRSFYSEQILEFGAGTGQAVTALFGPNSGGKSNTAQALALIESYIANSADANFVTPYDPFLLKDTSDQEPSCFELFFKHTDRYLTYAFGFTRDQVVYEELKEQPSITGKARIIFFRKADGSLSASADKFGFGKTLQKVTRKDTLLITKAHESNNEYAGLVFDLLKSLVIIPGGAPNQAPLFVELLKRDHALLDRTIKLLQECDFSIQGIELEKMPMPKEVLAALPLPEEIKSQIGMGTTLKTSHVVRDADQSVVGIRQFDFWRQESVGTQKFLETIVPVIDALDHGKTIYIDEFGTFIHPDLANVIIGLFKSKNNKKHAKLILNTHNASIMSPDILSREEIFFVERNFSEESIISSLADKSVRKDEAFGKRYRQGLYGGVPMIQDEPHT
ncbi:MAG: ATP-binding protein [Coriobacteriia bacterium]|nr:ATP-binding protein [Coriobacteriia bacterium]